MEKINQGKLEKEEIKKVDDLEFLFSKDIKINPYESGWSGYWRERLMPQKDKLPKNIQEILDNPEAERNREFAQYLSEEIKKSSQSEEERLFSNLGTKIEIQDAKMDSSQKGCFIYWKKRLAPEIEILPSEVRGIIRKMHQGENLDEQEQSKFGAYISKRIMILKSNLRKRLEMSELKKRLKDIDEEKEYSKEERKGKKRILQDVTGLYIIENGRKKKMDLGDIRADFDWGIKYMPDESLKSPKNILIWRKIRKISDFLEAKSKIEDLFNKEISKRERISLPTTDLSVDFIEKQLEKSIAIRGVIAERMAKNLLSRVGEKNYQTGLVVESSNAIEDAEMKYDFKIFVSKKGRGVAVEGEEVSRKEYIKNKKKIGIQFTVTEILDHKKEQIRFVQENLDALKLKYQDLIKKPVEDVVLVSLPFKTYEKYFKKWLVEGKPSGGPEQYLSKEEKIKLISETLKGFLDLSEEEISKLNI